MLVLSRKEGESLIVNDNIVVTIVRIAGGGVRIGIEAPREIPVLRAELPRGRDQYLPAGRFADAVVERPQKNSSTQVVAIEPKTSRA